MPGGQKTGSATVLVLRSGRGSNLLLQFNLFLLFAECDGVEVTEKLAPKKWNVNLVGESDEERYFPLVANYLYHGIVVIHVGLLSRDADDRQSLARSYVFNSNFCSQFGWHENTVRPRIKEGVVGIAGAFLFAMQVDWDKRSRYKGLSRVVPAERKFLVAELHKLGN